MLSTRVIPCLLIQDGRLVKGVRFKNHSYVGDPLNAIRIFNSKQVEELAFLDITATREGRTISPQVVKRMSEECFMPFAVGGGISSLQQAKEIITAGAEKVIIGTAAVYNPELITQISNTFGAQSVVVSVDVKYQRLFQRYRIYSHCAKKATKLDPVEYAKLVVKYGAGEILLNSIDRDGTMQGYDLELLKKISSAVSVPVIALGGAGKVEHLSAAVNQGKVSAVAAGSYFVFHGRRRAVLINFPDKNELDQALVANI